MNKRILYLPLKSKYYLMIESGEKKEEYRELKDYWATRILKEYPIAWRFNMDMCIELNDFRPFEGKTFGGWDIVQFSYGYTKRTMQFEVDKIEINTGNPEWGAEEGKKYFVEE